MLTVKKKNTKYYITSAIGILIMLLFGFLGPAGEMSALGMRILGIYLGAIFLWATTDVIWPSLLAIFLIGLTGYKSIGDFLVSGFGNSTLIFVWLCYVFAQIINESGVSAHVARAICSVKFAKGRPWVITFLFFLASYAVAALANVSGGIVICWAMFSEYARNIGCKKGEAWPVYTLTGMTLAGMAGSCAFSYRSPGNIFAGYAAQLGYEVSFLGWFVVGFVFTWLMMALYLALGRFVLKIDASKCASELSVEGNANRLTKYQKQLMVCLAILIVLFLAQGMLPATSAVGALLSKLGNCGIMLALLIPMALIHRKEDGKPFGDIVSATRKGVQWPVFYLLLLNLPMAGIINDPELGIAASVKLLLDPVFGGNSGSLLFMILTILFGILLTVFIGNVPATTICWSVTSIYAASLNVNLAMLACICTMIGTTTVMLPCSNPVAAMLHGQSDWLESRNVMKYAAWGLLLVFISALATYLVFGGWIFG